MKTVLVAMVILKGVVVRYANLYLNVTVFTLSKLLLIHREAVCYCCNGNNYHCSNCNGLCQCTNQLAIDYAWYPSAADCACCNGYAY